MRGLPLAAALAALAVAGPAAAQSSKELTWAMTNCLSNITALGAARKAFEARGYSYEVEDYGIGPEGVHHWYKSPDGKVDVGIVRFPGNESCNVYPGGATVGQALPFAKAAAEAVLKTPFKDGSPRGGPNITPASRTHEMCSGAWAKVRGGVVWVRAGSAGQDPACVANLPAQIDIIFTKG